MRSKSVSKLLWLAMFLAGSAQAVPVNFQGALVETLPCTVNDGQLIEVDFGDGIVIRSIDGVRYSQSVYLQIYCPSSLLALQKTTISINGTPTSFDSAAIQTDITGLGVHLNLSGQPLPLNSRREVMLSSDPNLPPEPVLLMVVPVVDPGSPPVPGAFTARATLLAEYP